MKSKTRTIEQFTKAYEKAKKEEGEEFFPDGCLIHDWKVLCSQMQEVCFDSKKIPRGWKVFLAITDNFPSRQIEVAIYVEDQKIGYMSFWFDGFLEMDLKHYKSFQPSVMDIVDEIIFLVSHFKKLRQLLRHKEFVREIDSWFDNN